MYVGTYDPAIIIGSEYMILLVDSGTARLRLNNCVVCVLCSCFLIISVTVS